jgi:hypothetical protein
MDGTIPGYLSILFNELNSSSPTIGWSEGFTNFGASWNYGSIGFYLDTPYFITIIGGHNDGVVALDDIIIKESEFCSTTPVSAQVPSGLPTRPTTTAVSPASVNKTSPYDCDFEKGYCSWKNDTSRPLRWLRNKGSTTTSDTGPSFDHT